MLVLAHKNEHLGSHCGAVAELAGDQARGELLSPSNVTNTWDNVRNYMTLPSVSEILIIDTTRVFAELFARAADGGWPADPREFKPGSLIPLASISFDLPLYDAYHGTHLAE